MRFHTTPEKAAETASTKMYWDENIITDHRLMHIQPDILVIFKKDKAARITDIAVPNDCNQLTTRVDKIRNYQELAIMFEILYRLDEVILTPVVISSYGLY